MLTLGDTSIEIEHVVGKGCRGNLSERVAGCLKIYAWEILKWTIMRCSGDPIETRTNKQTRVHFLDSVNMLNLVVRLLDTTKLSGSLSYYFFSEIARGAIVY